MNTLFSRPSGLAYERHGAGPPLVLLHGIGHSRRAWDPVVEQVAAYRAVYLVDLPGHGDSRLPATPGPHGVSELTDLIAALLSEIGLDRPAIAGNSLGGAIALELGRRGGVGPVVALAPIGFWSRLELAYCVAVLRTSRLVGHVLGPYQAHLLGQARLRAAALGFYFAHPSTLSRERAMQMVQNFTASPGVPAILPASRRYRFSGSASGPSAATTVAWGERDRLLIGRQASRARARLPYGKHVELPNCGHVPMFDDPGLVATLLVTATSETQ